MHVNFHFKMLALCSVFLNKEEHGLQSDAGRMDNVAVIIF